MSDVLRQLEHLAIEIDEYRAELRTRNVQIHGLGNFAHRVKKEISAVVAAYSYQDFEHRLASSNATDLARSWRLLRSLPAVTAVNTRAIIDKSKRVRDNHVIVDVIYRKGHAWCIRFSQRYRSLLQELANLPFVRECESIRGDDEDTAMSDSSSIDFVIDTEPRRSESPTDADDLFDWRYVRQTQMVRHMYNVLTAAANYPRLGLSPRICVYLPRLLEDAATDEAQDNCFRLSKILEDRLKVQVMLHSPGVPLDIDCNVQAQARDEFGNEPLELCLEDGATPRPVVLCVTTLFVLTSDLSNDAFNKDFRGLHSAQQFQLDEERRVSCLQARILPILAVGGELHTTEFGRQRLFQLVEQLGSSAEHQRAALLFDCLPSHGLTSLDRATALSNLSIHSWPDSIRLPIIVHEDVGDSMQGLFDMKTKTAQDVFALAWHRPSCILLSANKTAVTVFRRCLASENVRLAKRPRENVKSPDEESEQRIPQVSRKIRTSWPPGSEAQ
ncbi:hypothetical protein PYCC9005_001080 [Savitreella phatthalungensis]